MQREKRSLPATRTFRARPYRPAWWLPGPHAQSIAGRLVRPRGGIAVRRERLELSDGDFVDLDLTPSANPGAPLVLLLHGLEGSSRRGYAWNAYRQLERRGVGAIGLNFRGCSGEPNRLPRSYHSGETGDLTFVLDWLAARFAGSRLGMIGFSLGGNVLLKFLGEQGQVASARLTAAAAISVPFDLGACADALATTPMGRFYTRHFIRSLGAKLEAKSSLLDGRIDRVRARAARTFREFDDAVTAPLHGFDGAADYYTRSSSGAFLERIRVPVLLLQAEDDPFLPREALPRDEIAANPWLIPAFTREGGHVGFIEGQPWRPRFWVEDEAARFLAERLVP